MTTLSIFLKVWSIIQFQTEYLYFILSGKLQLDLSPVLWPLGATCECVPSLPSEKSHPPTSERSKLFRLLEALYLIHHCGVWPLSGSELSVATQTWCVGVPLPFFIFTDASLRNKYLLYQPILTCCQRQDSCRRGWTGVPFSVWNSHWCILLTSWGLRWFLNLVSRSNSPGDQTAQGRCGGVLVLALRNSRRWGTCPKITQQIQQVDSFLYRNIGYLFSEPPFLPSIRTDLYLFIYFYFQLQLLN